MGSRMPTSTPRAGIVHDQVIWSIYPPVEREYDITGGSPGEASDYRKNVGSLEVLDIFTIKERMRQALNYLKESTEDHQILVQVWAPIKSGNRYLLLTSGQPYVFLSPHSNGLHQYRTVSQMYSFSLDGGETDGGLGLPARVFRQKFPQWTPDVQYYSIKEYHRVKFAKDYNVHGTLALPVFEPSGQSCVVVLELVTTSKKIGYAPEIHNICKALQAVNLRSSKIFDPPNFWIRNQDDQIAFSEILRVLQEACETYNLPLAQTWIPCRHQSVLPYDEESSTEQVCLSTIDAAFYVVDARIWGFRKACDEHHLHKGQGVVGRAFESNGSCFCEAISKFSKREYPLMHYARMFGLVSSFAICLRSKYTGDDKYVVEIFLPTSLTDTILQHTLLDSIFVTLKQHFQSLMTASGRELEEERKFMEMVDVSRDE